MKPAQLTGTLELWNGALVAFVAPITADVDHEGLTIYRATLPLFLDGTGTPQLIHQCHVDMLPARSTLSLAFDPDLAPVTV